MQREYKRNKQHYSSSEHAWSSIHRATRIPRNHVVAAHTRTHYRYKVNPELHGLPATNTAGSSGALKIGLALASLGGLAILVGMAKGSNEQNQAQQEPPTNNPRELAVHRLMKLHEQNGRTIDTNLLRQEINTLKDGDLGPLATFIESLQRWHKQQASIKELEAAFEPVWKRPFIQSDYWKDIIMTLEPMASAS